MAPNESTLIDAIEQLAAPLAAEKAITPCGTAQYPSVDGLVGIMETVRTVLFPDFFDRQRGDGVMRRYFIGVNIEKLASDMATEIAHALKFNDVCNKEEADERARELATRFVGSLPEIKRLIYTDVEAVWCNDPAVTDYGEIVLCYPAVRAMLNYRTAHCLLQLGVPVIPRMLTEIAHSATGIDINPGARIGPHFAIDHGTGIVIGETAIIGSHCTLYQGVTLGAKSFTLSPDGRPVNAPRHPILEDNVTVYSNASILGRITVGHDTIVGGNVWLTHSVPPFSRILQRGAATASFTDGAGI